MNPFRRIAALFRREKLDADMRDEMQAHLEWQAAENEKRGMSPDEARYAAQRAFGGVEQIKERVRDQRAFLWLDQVGQDLRYAVRALRKTPSFAVTAGLTLALGIGVNAALFTVYNSVALRSLPSRDPDALVNIRGANARVRGFSSQDEPFSYPDYLDYRAENRAFSDLVAWAPLAAKLEGVSSRLDPLLETQTGFVVLHAVSGNYFSALGGRIVLGRDFLAAEADSTDAAPAIVLSDRFWRTRFQLDPEVLGKTIALDDMKGGGPRAFTVIGVAAPEFVGRSPVPPAGWIPLTMQPRELAGRQQNFWQMLGRLKPGVTMAQARADLDAIAQRLALAFPTERRKDSVRLEPAMRWVNLPITWHHLGEMSPLLIGFATVLVIACLNVANLLLARGITRQQEIGIRLTLGATRSRVLRQLFTENFLLCALGAGLGLILASWTLSALRPIAVSYIPARQWLLRSAWSLLDLGPDARTVGFIAMLALIAAIAAGLAPALHASRSNVLSALKDEGSAFGRRVRGSKARNLLIVAQLAVCLALLSCAGFMVKNFVRLRSVDLGFEPNLVFSASLTEPPKGAEPRAVFAQVRGTVETLRQLPDVASACLVRWLPVMQHLGQVRIRTTGTNTSDRVQTAHYTMVSAGFFETLSIPLQRGRAFTAREIETDAAVLVVSETAARRLWPGEEAVGKILALGGSPNRANGSLRDRDPAAEKYREYEVIGVARDIRREQAEEADKMLLFVPPPTDMTGSLNLLIRARSDSEASMAAIVRASAAAGVGIQLEERLTVRLQEYLLPLRALSWLFAGLGMLSLLLAAIGLYGVIAFAVNQRAREIGIRVALGATTRAIYLLIVRQGLQLVALGAVAGVVGGCEFSLLLSKIMAGKQDLRGPFDPWVLASVTALLTVVAIVACWLPARRATQVDPMSALRAE